MAGRIGVVQDGSTLKVFPGSRRPVGMRASVVLDAVRGGRWVPHYDPDADPIHRFAVDNHRSFALVEWTMWTLAVLFDTIDFVTTWFGVNQPGLREGIPFSRWVLDHFGLVGLFVEHVAALVVLVGLWYVLPKPYRLVVPGQFTVIGIVIVYGNITRLTALGITLVP